MKIKIKIIFGLLVPIILIVFLSQFASKSPDGLNKVAADKGFSMKSEGKGVIKSPLPGYAIPVVKNDIISNSLSGVIGVLLVFCVAFGLGYIFRKKK
ncbi:MAG: PDGLE domain-containing protein [Elusimicrobia bacterium]|nr:PDGLE domain-containing protein [Elusimicrobiota bacterium]